MPFSLPNLVPALLAVWLLKKFLFSKARTPSPPGPRPLPIIGNVLDVPQKEPWVAFTEWGKRYGECTDPYICV